MSGDTSLPTAWLWERRAKGVMPMPGGYRAYLTALAKVADLVVEERPAVSEFAGRLETVLDTRPGGARLRSSFLRKVELVVDENGLCRLGLWTERWRTTHNDRLIAALLHARCRFVGELLAATREARGHDELLAVANEQYDMGWDTPAQVAFRRGWLQSCGLVAATADGLIQATPAGLTFLEEIELASPATSSATLTSDEPTPVDQRTTPTAQPHDPRDDASDKQHLSPRPAVQALVDELRAAGNDSKDPARLERAARDAFEFLGFRAEWLGGSGRTDVLLDAMLGRDDSYRVIVDCKSTSSGAVADQQIDWVTLDDHRRKHDAQHIAVVGPNPSGTRLFGRAVERGVAVISIERLVGLCNQHARTPLTLDDYRTLFQSGGEPDVQTLEERSAEIARLLQLVVDICAAARARSDNAGRLTARDLYLILSTSATAEDCSEAELQKVLDALANPLLEVLKGDPANGYRLTTSPTVAAHRLTTLASAVAGPDG